MPWTVQQVITEVQKRFPDANATSCTTWFNMTHRDVCSRIPQLQMDTVTLSVTSGQQEYDIAEYVFQVREAEWVTAANASVKLELTTPENLDVLVPGWREAAPGTPSYYYLADNQASGNSEVLGLFPAPNVTTSTYPFVLMQVSDIASSDLTTSSTLPPTIPSADVYVEGVCKHAAIALRPTMALQYNSTYESWLKAVEKYVLSRANENRRTVSGNIRTPWWQTGP